MTTKITESKKIEDVLPLKQNEIDLIHIIRHVYRYGKILIEVRDGIPGDIIITQKRIRLGNLSTDDFDEL